jgi:hypothetical protein
MELSKTFPESEYWKVSTTMRLFLKAGLEDSEV